MSSRGALREGIWYSFARVRVSSGGALHEGIRYFYLAAFEAGLRRVLVREGTCVLQRCAPRRYLVFVCEGTCVLRRCAPRRYQVFLFGCL